MMFFCIKLIVFIKNIALVGFLERFIDTFYEKMDLKYEISTNQTNITIKFATMYFIVKVHDRHWKSKEKTKANMSCVFSQHTQETVWSETILERCSVEELS